MLETKRLAALMDRGGTLVGMFSPEYLERYAQDDTVRVVRNRKGEIKRVQWLGPGEVAYPDHGFHRRGNPLAQYMGSRYVFLETVVVDAPYRVFALVESRFMPPEMMAAVTRGITVEAPCGPASCMA